MSWLAAAGRELFGLFVDDVPYSVAILAWLGLGDFGLHALAVDTAWDAPLLALGVLAILFVSVGAAAHRHRKTRHADK